MNEPLFYSVGADERGREIAVCFNPGGRWHGWLFYRHPDGQLVSLRKLEQAKNPYGTRLTSLTV